jgi:hypothetical protein
MTIVRKLALTVGMIGISSGILIGGTAEAATVSGKPEAALAHMAPAIAASAGDCPVGYFCFWAHDNFSGPMGKFRGSNRNWGAYSQSACRKYGTWNDCASSYWNRTGKTVRVWWNNDFQGAHADLDNVPRTVSREWNDQISSNQVF